MFFSTKKFITATLIGAVSLTSLSACVVSDDPYVNTVATAAATTGAVSLLLYAMNDGYYYDQHYNRMPYNYRPPQNVQIVHVNNIHEYRKAHPRPISQQRVYPVSQHKKQPYPQYNSRYNTSHQRVSPQRPVMYRQQRPTHTSAIWQNNTHRNNHHNNNANRLIVR